MLDDWTLHLTASTSLNRQASTEEVKAFGAVLNKPAELKMHGSSIHLKVSGFASKDEAEGACHSVCWGLRRMALSIPIAIEIDVVPQTVIYSENPRDAARNISKSFGHESCMFGPEVHGAVSHGAPAIYPTSYKMVIFQGFNADVVISGMGDADRVLRLIAEGSEKSLTCEETDRFIETAVELFNASGFERSVTAEFILLFAALETVFPSEDVDKETLKIISELSDWLKEKAKSNGPIAQRILTLEKRIMNLTKGGVSKSVREGVAQFLYEDPLEQKDTSNELGELYALRSRLAHQGEADIDNRLHRLREIVQQVLLKKLAPK